MGKWIKVSEKLPKTDGIMLIVIKDCDAIRYSVGRYRCTSPVKTWWFNGYGEIIAWQPITKFELTK